MCLPFPLAMNMIGEEGKTKALAWARDDFNEFRVDQALPPYNAGRDTKFGEDDGITVGNHYIRPTFKGDRMFAEAFDKKEDMTKLWREGFFGSGDRKKEKPRNPLPN